ncbi:MAG: phage integrase N-terminal SAM-like domain-containing protein, partial [Deltaproteobacteria bacterium]|nr:phage integrase N-terminal SAM-like domain-containing protein [Deltaproteobacteria bacterium]
MRDEDAPTVNQPGQIGGSVAPTTAGRSRRLQLESTTVGAPQESAQCSPHTRRPAPAADSIPQPRSGRSDSSTAPPPRKLLDQVSDALRARHYSYRTEEAYVGWIRRFILFHHKRHPAQMGKPEIERFLTALAVDRRVSASTQNQALAALLFLYKQVMGRDPGWLDDVARAKRPQRLPTVLTRPEVEAILGALDGVSWIMAALLYGAGLRLTECLRLRVKDIDFTRNEILVREGKGNKDRVTMLPLTV